MACIDRAFAQVADRPLIYPVAYALVRRALLRRFPCSVCFIIEDDRVTVLALHHQRRDPASRPNP